MFDRVSERRMHHIRWVVTSGWLLLIVSLFYDPISAWLTSPNTTWSLLRIDPLATVQVQDQVQSASPYPMGTSIFWGIVVPAAIWMLLIFGHELWRRICPLSFLSQLPAALKWQRHQPLGDAKTGRTREAVIRIQDESWLGRHHLYVQMGWLYVGLCARLLLIDADRTALGVWLLLTIGVAIAIGYRYGGKSWCQYFCPMAPVQMIFAEPGGLFTSKAHMQEQPITQSMCRRVDRSGEEQSACVACKSPCMDIDAERSYWDGIKQPDRQVLYYGYLGLVLGFFGYYYLYAGNWEYYFSGAWARQEHLLSQWLSPGFYLFQQPIAIPKLVAVPLTLGVSSWSSYQLGKRLEAAYQGYLSRRKSQRRSPSLEQIRHRSYTLCTFLAFNLFLVFGGRPFIHRLPLAIEYLYNGLIVLVSSVWLLKTWERSPDRYARESSARRLRQQLGKLELDLAEYLQGRSLTDLNTDEIYVLARVLPGFTRQAYREVLQEALEEGYVDTASSLEVLQHLRTELGISERDHHKILAELGVSDPELLNPTQQRNRENLVRLTGYRKSLERLVRLQQQRQRQEEPPELDVLLETYAREIQTLGRRYAISHPEEERIRAYLDPKAGAMRRATFLLTQLQSLVDRYRALHQPLLIEQRPVLALLHSAVRQQKQLLVMGLLEILVELGTRVEAHQIAQSLNQIGSVTLQEQLATATWRSQLSLETIGLLTQPSSTTAVSSLDLEPTTIADHLQALLLEPNPFVQSASLYLLYQLDPDRGRHAAQQVLATDQPLPFLVQETAQLILSPTTPTKTGLSVFPSLEELVHLYSHAFFQGVSHDTLMALTRHAEIKTYQAGDSITEAGDTCRELLMLIDGSAQVRQQSSNDLPEGTIQTLAHGQLLDELEVLSGTERTSTIVATAPNTRILTIPVDRLDALLEHDPGFARRILAMESRRLRELLLP
jgi:hypothetical protein